MSDLTRKHSNRKSSIESSKPILDFRLKISEFRAFEVVLVGHGRPHPEALKSKIFNQKQ
jgi:hypothetical protein